MHGFDWLLDIGELSPQARPAERVARFVAWSADFIGDLAVKAGLIGVLICGIAILTRDDTSERLLWGGGVLASGLVAASGLWQILAHRKFKAIDEGRGESMLRTMRMAAWSGLPILGSGVAFLVLAFTVGVAIDWEYVIAVVIVFVTAICGPLAAMFGLARFGPVYRALDAARVDLFGGADVEGEPEDDADDEAFADP